MGSAVAAVMLRPSASLHHAAVRSAAVRGIVTVRECATRAEGPQVTQGWEGDDYQAWFDALAASGVDVHGEADFVMTLSPASVLDAGCGTGRVAIELDRRGVEVVGVDVDPSMLDAAHRRAPDVEWVAADLADFDLGRTFDVVVMAGNVPLFTAPGTNAAVVERCARHLAPGGALVAGFQHTRGYSLDDYDADCTTAGLALDARYATWDRVQFPGDGSYAVSVHRRPG
jgi:SAM-dependent methyltransferase